MQFGSLLFIIIKNKNQTEKNKQRKKNKINSKRNLSLPVQLAGLLIVLLLRLLQRGVEGVCEPNVLLLVLGGRGAVKGGEGGGTLWNGNINHY